MTSIPLAGHMPGVTVSWEMLVLSRGLQGDQLPTLRWEARAHRHAVFTQHGLSLPDPYIICVPPRREQSDPHTLSLSGASQGSDLTRGFLPSWPDTCSICHCPVSVNLAPARLFLTCSTRRVCVRLNSTPDVVCVCCSPLLPLTFCLETISSLQKGDKNTSQNSYIPLAHSPIVTISTHCFRIFFPYKYLFPPEAFESKLHMS